MPRSHWEHPVSDASAVPGMTAEEVSDLTSTFTDPEVDVSMTQQQFANEVDINTIVSRFGITPQVALDRMGVYADFSMVRDFESARAAVEGAYSRFMSLPAEVREAFGNDPGVLIQAAQELPPAEFMRIMDPKPAPPVVDPPPASGG